MSTIAIQVDELWAPVDKKHRARFVRIVQITAGRVATRNCNENGETYGRLNRLWLDDFTRRFVFARRAP